MLKYFLILTLITVSDINAQQFFQYPQQYYYQQQQFYYPQQQFYQQQFPQFSQQQPQQVLQQQSWPQQQMKIRQQQQFPQLEQKNNQQQQINQQLVQQNVHKNQQQEIQPTHSVEEIPKKPVFSADELEFDLPPPPPSQFLPTKAVQPISRTHILQRNLPPQRRVVSASHRVPPPSTARHIPTPVRAPQFPQPKPAPRIVQQPSPRPTPTTVRPVTVPAPVSHLSPNKNNPNSFFLQCCKAKKVAKSCESRCNFEVLTKKVLTGMFLGSDPCPQSHGLDLFSCAAQDGDHTPCCRRNNVHKTSAGEKCLAFCKMTPDSTFQADASYLPCWAVLNKIKVCFKNGIINGIEV